MVRSTGNMSSNDKHHMTCAAQGSTISRPQIKERALFAVCTSIID